MNLLFLILISQVLSYENIDSRKMKIKILPGDNHNDIKPIHLLKKLTDSINQNKIQDFVSLKNIKPETVLTKVKSYKPYLVRIPLKCDIMKNGCDKDKISDELSMYLNISHSRLNVKIIN